MREMVITQSCDDCYDKQHLKDPDARVPATEEVTIMLGTKPRRLDLCEASGSRMTLPRLRELAELYGADPQSPASPPRTAPRVNGSTTGEWPCPVDTCPRAFSTRSGVLAHLTSTVTGHSMSMVEATAAAPPRTPATTCPECGETHGDGSGMALHMRSAHNREYVRT